jgi:hypothetical protein
VKLLLKMLENKECVCNNNIFDPFLQAMLDKKGFFPLCLEINCRFLSVLSKHFVVYRRCLIYVEVQSFTI